MNKFCLFSWIQFFFSDQPAWIIPKFKALIRTGPLPSSNLRYYLVYHPATACGFWSKGRFLSESLIRLKIIFPTHYPGQKICLLLWAGTFWQNTNRLATAVIEIAHNVNATANLSAWHRNWIGNSKFLLTVVCILVRIQPF